MIALESAIADACNSSFACNLLAEQKFMDYKLGLIRNLAVDAHEQQNNRSADKYSTLRFPVVKLVVENDEEPASELTDYD